jgi:hypothetical protein
VSRGYERLTARQCEAVIAAWPRGDDFGREMIDGFYEGMRHRPDSTYGTFNDDILGDSLVSIRRERAIRGSWQGSPGLPSQKSPTTHRPLPMGEGCSRAEWVMLPTHCVADRG